MSKVITKEKQHRIEVNINHKYRLKTKIFQLDLCVQKMYREQSDT